MSNGNPKCMLCNGQNHKVEQVQPEANGVLLRCECGFVFWTTYEDRKSWTKELQEAVKKCYRKQEEADARYRRRHRKKRAKFERKQ